MKRILYYSKSGDKRVAPHAGAWIETIGYTYMPHCVAMSRPTRARGLKLDAVAAVAVFLLSRPTRARGLKLRQTIEQRGINQSRPTRARGLKPYNVGLSTVRNGSRPTRARGLKHR